MVDQDVLDTDAEHFDCETCPVRCMQGTLDAPNWEAWDIYHRLHARLVVDLKLAPVLFPVLVNGWPAPDVLELTERLAILHDVLAPMQSQNED
jgi:hypothetical protein